MLGVWVAALLIVFEALFFGLLGLALSLVGRLRLWPLAAACCWVLIEFAYSRIPFGGFGWTRIAYAAVDTPLAGFLPFIGVAGLSFVVALTGQLIAWLVIELRARRAGEPRRSGRLLVGRGGAGRAGRRPDRAARLPGGAGGHRVGQVGIVQGNIPGRGIEAMGRARSVTNNHLSETIELMTRARLGQVAAAGLPAVAGELHRHRSDGWIRSPGRPWRPRPRSPVGRSWSVR